MSFKEWILNTGWRCVLPALKMYHRICYKCSFGRHSFYSYKTVFEGHNGMGEGSRIIGGFMGKGSYVADDVRFYDTCVGKFTSIGHRSATINGSHPLMGNFSLHPAFYNSGGVNGLRYTKESKYEEFKYINKDKSIAVIIGNDVWIGADVKIMEGVTIGDGAVVAAGSLVTKNIPPYEIWMGAPAKKYSDRFEPAVKQKLIESKWWNFEDKRLEELSSDFDDINRFLEDIKG